MVFKKIDPLVFRLLLLPEWDFLTFQTQKVSSKNIESFLNIRYFHFCFLKFYRGFCFPKYKKYFWGFHFWKYKKSFLSRKYNHCFRVSVS